MINVIKANQNQNCLPVKPPADNHSPDKELGMFVLILHYLTLPYMVVVSLSDTTLKFVDVLVRTGPFWFVSVNRDTPTD